MLRIAVLDDYQGVALEMADWRQLPPDTQIEVFRDYMPDEPTRAQRLRDFEVIVAMRERTPFPASLLKQLPDLKLLITTGGRNLSFDVAAAQAQGVVVCGTRSMGSPTAELTWGLILALVRSLPGEDNTMRQGGWQTRLGPSLDGKTLGIVGLGSLGSRVAAVGKLFRMDVIAWSQNLTADRAAELGARSVSKEDLFAQADVVSIHYVLSDRSRGLVGAPDLARMKPTAYLVNTSRGPIVDEAALIETLQANRIAGAGLDVYDQEPLPADHPIRRLPNVVLTPHMGYVTSDNYRLFYGDAFDDIAAWLAGAPLRVIAPA